jgi:hypothetical protein
LYLLTAGLAHATVRPPANPATSPPAAESTAAIPAPILDVYTMGAGDYFFSLFGHAAVCVTDEKSPSGRCYNWGTADFSNPLRLAWQVVRGRAQFWVGVIDQPRMVSSYIAEDRSLFRQRLRLSPQATRRLVDILHRVDEREASLYTYHNLRDNCSTRVRDALDEATAGSLRRNPLVHRRDQPSFRADSHEGFAGQPHLQAGALLLFGRAVDRPTSRYESLFLPRALRDELALQLDADPEPLYARKGPQNRGGPHAGAALLLALGLVASAGCLYLARRRALRSAMLPAALLLGPLGCLLLLLLLVSPLPELRYNEVLLLCWPCDLFLPLLPRTWLRPYLTLRIGTCGLCALAAVLGVLRQPLWGPLGLALPLLLSCWAAVRRGPHDPAPV